MTKPPYLTDEEIGEICDPLKQPHAQLRYLLGLGIPASRKPGGRPLVGRAAFERAMAGAAAMAADVKPDQSPSAQPDAAALERVIKQRKHGTQAQIH